MSNMQRKFKRASDRSNGVVRTKSGRTFISSEAVRQLLKRDAAAKLAARVKAAEERYPDPGYPHRNYVVDRENSSPPTQPGPGAVDVCTEDQLPPDTIITGVACSAPVEQATLPEQPAAKKPRAPRKPKVAKEREDAND